MRLLLTFTSEMEFDYYEINKHHVQGLIYSLLQDTRYEKHHDAKKFKFFTFSDIFPLGNFQPNQNKNLLVSSPDPGFIGSLQEKLKKEPKLRLGNYDIKVKNYKTFKLRVKRRFTSSSPVVLYKDNREGLYFSFKRDNDLNFFLERLKENAIKKYNVFYSEDLSLEENIFDRLKFKKEVVVKLRKQEKEFLIIGTVWRLLEKFRIPSEKRKFYQFIMDCGLGEKNSLGFGFINPLR